MERWVSHWSNSLSRQLMSPQKEFHFHSMTPSQFGSALYLLQILGRPQSGPSLPPPQSSSSHFHHHFSIPPAPSPSQTTPHPAHHTPQAQNDSLASSPPSSPPSLALPALLQTPQATPVSPPQLPAPQSVPLPSLRSVDSDQQSPTSRSTPRCC